MMVVSNRLRNVSSLTCLCLLGLLIVTHWQFLGHPARGGYVEWLPEMLSSSQPFLPAPPDDDEELARALYHYLYNPELCCKRLTLFGGISVGRKIDGDKFICLDPEYAPSPGDCLVYSVGISYEWSFDRDVSDYGCEVHAFDPSMDPWAPNVTSFGARFYRIGLAGRSRVDHRGWRVMTLTDLRALLGHQRRQIDYLKVDIEGAEWDWLSGDMESLRAVRQMGMEVHMNVTATELRRYYRALRELRRVGFRTIHSNINRVAGKRRLVAGMKGSWETCSSWSG
ncbi:methyltransferase-like protein 24 [Pollicipes pollicipes]|uniref:methyltransferase-like protein 24 n=1 Tax=Pollicipes pollicipes TaxID=41117 RepID=UPI001885916C|nr:methyltransferase-like protein 24 [Pollicipes pollicipes]